MLDLGEPVVNLVLTADPVKDVLQGVNVPLVMGKLNTIILQNNVEPMGQGCDKVAQKRRNGYPAGLLVQFNQGELGSAVDGNAEMQLAYGRMNFSNINVEVAVRVGFEHLLRSLVAVNLGRAADIVPLKAAVKG